MSLPIVMSPNQQMTQMQNLWSASLNPILNNELVNGRLVRNVELITGTTVINHGLGRVLNGWLVTRLRGSGPTIYDTQSTNTMPQLTLNLVSSAPVTIDLWVF